MHKLSGVIFDHKVTLNNHSRAHVYRTSVTRKIMEIKQIFGPFGINYQTLTSGLL